MKHILFIIFSFFILLSLAWEWSPTPADPSTWSVHQLKHYLDTHGVDYSNLSHPGRAEYVRLVEETAATFAARKESLREWFENNKDAAPFSLNSPQDIVESMVDELKDELKNVKGLTQDQINSVINTFKTRVENVKDWANVKESQAEVIYADLKHDLGKEAELKKIDLESVIVKIKAAIQSTINKYTTSAASASSSASGAAFDYVTSKVADVYSSAASIVGGALHKASNSVSDSAHSASNTASSVSHQASSQASSASSAIRESIKSAARAVSESASSAATATPSSISSIISSATNAASESASSAYDAAGESLDYVLRPLRNRLESTKEWSEAQINGMITYIKDNFFMARITTEREANSFFENFKEYLKEKKDASEEQTTFAVDSVKEAIEKMKKNMPWGVSYVGCL